jgi:uncharacterized protein (TIGR01777 family)
MRILVTGGSGVVGRRIVDALLERGEEVVVSGRNAAKIRKFFSDRVEAMEWEPMNGPPQVEGIDAIMHLAGENIGKGRWTSSKKLRIVKSRTVGTRNLVRGAVACDSKPSVIVTTSAIGIYGPTGHNIAHEGSAHGRGDFLADLCRDWEAEAIAARQHGIRVPVIRSGVVFGRGGGAYPPQRRLFRLGLGGNIGLGKGWLSWIHIDDLVALYVRCLTDDNMRGVYNGTAPNPVSNMEFTRELAKSLSRPAIMPVPQPALRVALGEFANYVTMSQRVRPLRTIAAGFEFKYPTLRPALEALAGRQT